MTVKLLSSYILSVVVIIKHGIHTVLRLRINDLISFVH